MLAAIRNLGGRDFDKKKWIIAGIYMCEQSDRLVGLAEMFDYKQRTNQITIGYRINESFWHKKIATNAVSLMKQYLCNFVDIKIIQAFVMPENTFSEKVLIKNGFKKEPYIIKEKNWGECEIADLNVFTYKIKHS